MQTIMAPEFNVQATEQTTVEQSATSTARELASDIAELNASQLALIGGGQGSLGW